MSRIRGSGTQLEKRFVETLLRHCRRRFQLKNRHLIGNPDIVFLHSRICVFLDSDFWHGWQYPRWKRLLKSDFWRDKIEANRARDRKVTRALRRKGWTVIRYWEHDLKCDLEDTVCKLVAIVRDAPRLMHRR